MIRLPYTAQIALRYLGTRTKSAFISFISAVSMLGIAIAIAVLIIVMAVINGFETELERRILSVTADATIEGYAQGFAAPVDDWPALRAQALARADVVAAAPFVGGQALVTTADALVGVRVRGVDVELEPSVSTLHERIVAGDFESLASGWTIVIGSALAAELGLGVGDTLNLMLPTARVTPAALLPRYREMTVGGIFDVGMQEFDRGLVLVGFDRATTLYGTGGRATGLSFDVTDRYEARTIVYDVATELPGDYFINDWSRRHINVFRSIELTKPLLFIMLSLVIGVAAFNIISTLFMVVREKRGDIAILRSIGSAPRSILSIFVIQGSSIGLIGMLGGLLLGLLLVAYLGTIVNWVEASFGLDLLAADVYLIGELPTEARLGEIAQICALAFVLAVAATIYPAYRASREPPAEALRYE